MKELFRVTCIMLACVLCYHAGTRQPHPSEFRNCDERSAYEKGYQDAYVFVLRHVNSCNSYIGTIEIGDNTIMNATNCLFLSAETSVHISGYNSQFYGGNFMSGFQPTFFWWPPEAPVEAYMRTVRPIK